MEAVLGLFAVLVLILAIAYVVKLIMAVWYHAERQKEMVSLLKDIRDRLPGQSAAVEDAEPSLIDKAAVEGLARQQAKRAARTDALQQPAAEPKIPVYCATCEQPNDASASKCSSCGAALSVSV